MSMTISTKPNDNPAAINMLLLEDSLVIRRMLAHYAKKEQYTWIEAGSLSELEALSERLADVQVAWVDLNLDDANCKAAVDYLRQCNPNVAVILMSAASQVEVALASNDINADFFAVKPIPYDQFRIFSHNGLQLWQRKRRAQIGWELQRQFCRFSEAFYDESPQVRSDYAERVLALTATALDAAIGVSSVAAFRWDGQDGGVCQMAWGQADIAIGAPVQDPQGLFAKACRTGGLQLQPNDLQAARHSYLRKCWGHSLAVLSGSVDAAAGALIWVLSRADAPPFSAAQMNVAADMVRKASFAATQFEHYALLEAAYEQVRLDQGHWQDFLPTPHTAPPLLRVV